MSLMWTSMYVGVALQTKPKTSDSADINVGFMSGFISKSSYTALLWYTELREN